MSSENPFEAAERWEPFLEKYISEEGNYVFEILEAEGTSAKGGQQGPQIFLQLEAKEGRIRDWLNYNEGRSLGKVTSLYESAGIPVPQPGEFDPSDHCRLTQACIDRLVGRRVGAVVRKEDSYKTPGETILRVQGYVAPSRLTDDLPVDTRGLPDVSAVSSSANPDEPDVPF